MFDFFQNILAQITAFFTVVIITITSILPGATSNVNKPVDTSITSPSTTISVSPTPLPPVVKVASPTPTIKPMTKETPANSPIPKEPTPSPTPSYNDLHCPKILNVEDSLGNKSTNSDIRSTFKKGEVNSLTVKITASDPQNLPLYFQFLPDANLGADMKDWSKDSSFTMNISNATPGSYRGIWIRVDNQDGYGCIGAYYDTQARLSYDVTQ